MDRNDGHMVYVCFSCSAIFLTGGSRGLFVRSREMRVYAEPRPCTALCWVLTESSDSRVRRLCMRHSNIPGVFCSPDAGSRQKT